MIRKTTNPSYMLLVTLATLACSMTYPMALQEKSPFPLVLNGTLQTQSAPALVSPVTPLEIPTETLSPTLAQTVLQSGVRATFGVSVCLGIVYGLKCLKDYFKTMPSARNAVLDLEDASQMLAKRAPQVETRNEFFCGLTLKQQVIGAFLASHTTYFLLFDLPLLAVTSSISPYLKWAFIAGDLWFSWTQRVKPLVDLCNDAKTLKNVFDDNNQANLPTKLKTAAQGTSHGCSALNRLGNHFSQMNTLFDRTYGKLGLPHPLLPQTKSFFFSFFRNLFFKS